MSRTRGPLMTVATLGKGVPQTIVINGVVGVLLYGADGQMLRGADGQYLYGVR